MIGKKVLVKLEKVSISNLKRMLKIVGRNEPKLATQQPKRLQTYSLHKQYPMSKIACDIAEAGHFKVDLVHHSGENAIGEYFHTLQLVDIVTGWSEIVAIFGRSYRVMADGFDYILARLPFEVQEIHPDNCVKFFNIYLLQYWKEKAPDLQLSCSRLYQKNDNRFVEENNHSLIRAYICHDRSDTQVQLKVFRQ